MMTPLEQALHLGAGFTGLEVCRAARGVGPMMTLDVGKWLDGMGRGERSLWICGAVWRLGSGNRFVADSVSSSDAAIDEALAGLGGKTVSSVSIHDSGEIAVEGEDWKLVAFPIRSETDNWVLFDEGDSLAVYSGPNGVLASEPLTQS